MFDNLKAVVSRKEVKLLIFKYFNGSAGAPTF